MVPCSQQNRSRQSYWQQHTLPQVLLVLQLKWMGSLLQGSQHPAALVQLCHLLHLQHALQQLALVQQWRQEATRTPSSSGCQTRMAMSQRLRFSC
jgi:hypothetical protein